MRVGCRHRSSGVPAFAVSSRHEKPPFLKRRLGGQPRARGSGCAHPELVGPPAGCSVRRFPGCCAFFNLVLLKTAPHWDKLGRFSFLRQLRSAAKWRRGMRSEVETEEAGGLSEVTSLALWAVAVLGRFM